MLDRREGNYEAEDDDGDRCPSTRPMAAEQDRGEPCPNKRYSERENDARDRERHAGERAMVGLSAEKCPQKDQRGESRRSPPKQRHESDSVLPGTAERKEATSRAPNQDNENGHGKNGRCN